MALTDFTLTGRTVNLSGPFRNYLLSGFNMLMSSIAKTGLRGAAAKGKTVKGPGRGTQGPLRLSNFPALAQMATERTTLHPREASSR